MLFVGCKDIFRDGSACDAPVHGLPLNELVRLVFRHFELLDEYPFCPVDEPDLRHLLLQRRSFLLHAAKARARGAEELERRRKKRGGGRLLERQYAAALALAEEKNLDLVKIAPNAVPPVCKIMDYGKFRFEQLKKEKEARKNQKVVEVKEIRMSPSIDTNDFNTKVKNAQKFLKDGNRVKVTVRFRGREMAHTSLGEQLLKQFGADCDEIATVAKGAKLEGRNMSMFLSPKNSK